MVFRGFFISRGREKFIFGLKKSKIKIRNDEVGKYLDLGPIFCEDRLIWSMALVLMRGVKKE